MWHRPPWPSDHLKSQRGQSRQDTHLAGSLKGSIILQNTVVILEDAIIIILTLERNAKRMEAVTYLYEWDGRSV